MITVIVSIKRGEFKQKQLQCTICNEDLRKRIMLNLYETKKRFTQCLNLLLKWRVKDKSPIGNGIQHDSNELLARHQPYLESL